MAALDAISKNPNVNPEIRSTANNLKTQFLKYEIIMTANFFFFNIFYNKPPVKENMYVGIDLLKANNMIKTFILQLNKLQRDFESVKNSTKKFSLRHTKKRKKKTRILH